MVDFCVARFADQAKKEIIKILKDDYKLTQSQKEKILEVEP